MNAYRPYAGIGSRETPDEILPIMRNLAYVHTKIGWTLRSGGAPGADSEFEQGAFAGLDSSTLEPWPEIYLPWDGFNGRPIGPDHIGVSAHALEIASFFHPAWDRLSQGARKLHARNVYQVLGPDPLPNVGQSPRYPSAFVVCWTKGGKGGGGTGQALRIAKFYKIEIHDLATEEGMAWAMLTLSSAWATPHE